MSKDLDDFQDSFWVLVTEILKWWVADAASRIKPNYTSDILDVRHSFGGRMLEKVSISELKYGIQNKNQMILFKSKLWWPGCLPR